jgi:hypothetical protein
LEEQNPTPTTEGGASTLDRLERYLAAQDAPDQTQAEPASAESAAAEVEPDEGVSESEGPQVTTADLAKYLGVEPDLLDLDEDGTIKLKTKVDGKEGAAKLSQLLKDHQIQGAAENRLREASEREKALQAREQEVQQQYQQKLQYAENLTQIAANQLLQEYQQIDWNALEQQDAGQAALLRQKFTERQAQLRGAMQNIEQQRMFGQQKWQAEQAQALQREAERLPTVIPEWKNAEVAEKERREIREWALKAGWEPAEIDNISRAHHVAVLRKAMLADRLQSSRPEVENKVRQAPKLVKPGQAVQNTQDQKLSNLKTAIRKSGRKTDAVEAYLMASGLV